MFPAANVIRYLPDGDPEAPVIVYHDPANLDLAHPYWVADGRAYLLHNWGDTSATLVFRSGYERVIEIPPDLHMIAATPDGWLMQRFEQDLYQFQVVGSEVMHQFWLDIAGPVKILEAPALGAADLESLTPVIK
jgi:hypothetical protein